MRALLVEDDEAFSLLAQGVLEQEGFTVDAAENGTDGMALAVANDYDCIVLDLGIPDMGGVQVVQCLRRDGRTPSIMILTATADGGMTIAALVAGADDYVTRPVVIEQLKARIRALVRRGSGGRVETLSYGNLTPLCVSRQVAIAGREIHLTAKEHLLLEHLLIHEGQVISRADIRRRVWGKNFDPGTNVFDVNVARLLKKLPRSGADVRTEVKRGTGFVLPCAHTLVS